MFKDITFHVPVDILENFLSFLDISQAILSKESLLPEEVCVLELVQKVLKENGVLPSTRVITPSIKGEELKCL